MNGTKTLGFYALLALTISSMIGSGIFAISSDIASVASLGSVLVAWVITGLGITMLALTFLYINKKVPSIETGIVGYIKDGFGSYASFKLSWGYWISAFLGNVALMMLLGQALSVWFPIFENSAVALLLYTTLNTTIFIIAAKGIKEAALLNTILMFVKIIPIALFCIFAIFAFDFSRIDIDFWGNGLGLGSVFNQVKKTMLITLWAFIGIEGAVMFTSRAKKRSQVGVATVVGVLIVLVMLMVVSIAPYGIVPYNELIELENPAMAGVFSYIIGYHGRSIISLAVVLSVLGAFVSWMLVTSEILYASAKQGSAPLQLKKENKVGTPVNALLTTVIAQQIFFVIIYFNEASFTAAYLLATSMILIPYLFTSFYGILLTLKNKKETKPFEAFAFVVSSAFCIWLVYAAGLKYILLSSVLYSFVMVAYIYTQKQLQQKLFSNKIELSVAILTVLVALFAVYEIYQGNLTL